MRKQSSAAARVADICGIIRLGVPLDESESGPDACRGANFPELSSTALAIIPLAGPWPNRCLAPGYPVGICWKGLKRYQRKVVKENQERGKPQARVDVDGEFRHGCRPGAASAACLRRWNSGSNSPTLALALAAPCSVFATCEKAGCNGSNSVFARAE